MGLFRFLGMVLTLGIYRPKGRQQTGLRHYQVSFMAPRWGTPAKEEMKSFLCRWFSEEEAQYHMSVGFRPWANFYLVTQSDGDRFCSELEDMFRGVLEHEPKSTKIRNPTLWINGELVESTSLFWCNSCDELTMDVGWDWDDDSRDDDGNPPVVHHACDSTDVTRLSDMSTKEIQKHVKQAA